MMRQIYYRIRRRRHWIFRQW